MTVTETLPRVTPFEVAVIVATPLKLGGPEKLVVAVDPETVAVAVVPVPAKEPVAVKITVALPAGTLETVTCDAWPQVMKVGDAEIVPIPVVPQL